MRVQMGRHGPVVLTVALRRGRLRRRGDEESSSASACRGDATTEATDFRPRSRSRPS